MSATATDSPMPPAASLHHASERSLRYLAFRMSTTLSAAQSCSFGLILTPCTKRRSRGGTTKSERTGAGDAPLARSSAERLAHESSPSSLPSRSPSSPSKCSSPGNTSRIFRPRDSSSSFSKSEAPPPAPLLSPESGSDCMSSSSAFAAAPKRVDSSFLLLASERKARLTFTISPRFDNSCFSSFFNSRSTISRKAGFRRSYCSTIHCGIQAERTGSSNISIIAKAQSQFLGRFLQRRSSQPLALSHRNSVLVAPSSKASTRSARPRKRSNSDGSAPARIVGVPNDVLPSNRLSTAHGPSQAT